MIDKLIKVFTKGRTKERILLHVEVLRYKDKDFVKRMFPYYRIPDR